MTTTVPPGTSDDVVNDVRGREAACSRQLAAQRTLLRLWRPPLAPGEWRTLGLFAADDAARLETALASMPLRVWRTDDVTPLRRHPNDPAAPLDEHPGREFLTQFTVTIPAAELRADVEAVVAHEATRAKELAGDGQLERLWTLPAPADVPKVLGLWRVADRCQLDEVICSLPMYPWLSVEVAELDPHPNDPRARRPDRSPGAIAPPTLNTNGDHTNDHH